MAHPVVASSDAESAALAANEIAAALGDDPFELVVAFFATTLDAAKLAAELRRCLPTRTRIIGCSTAGEIGPAGYQNQTLVVLALPASHFSAATTMLPLAPEFDLTACRQRVVAALAALDADAPENNATDSFALALVDGLSLREEAVGHAIQTLIGSIPLVGGSAGDALQFQRTWVIHEDTACEHGAVLAIVRSRLPLHVFKTQHFVRSSVRMVVTGARPEERIVTEINAMPAAQEYARLAGLPIENLDAMAFAAYPVLVRIGGTEHVRSIQKVNPDGSLSFFCAIDEGIVLSLAEGVDPVHNLDTLYAECVAEVGEPEAILACDCILRRLEFQQRETIEEISDWLSQHRAIGFSTYGELFNGVHVNQTLTGIAFGPERADPPK